MSALAPLMPLRTECGGQPSGPSPEKGLLGQGPIQPLRVGHPPFSLEVKFLDQRSWCPLSLQLPLPVRPQQLHAPACLLWVQQVGSSIQTRAGSHLHRAPN